ncbi:hypothetical protein PROFUN_01626 [Planoprotostelium fungivorum]|uniref:Uncharacterized protein n=1 Tax=Planoprotostelium fungivorum TaxID=1890364 RepID=A0A2P6NTS5_9EUKA|nr:hypothetical protein PROFUN_01626 [Planoprotostelium fungivorum]
MLDLECLVPTFLHNSTFHVNSDTKSKNCACGAVENHLGYTRKVPMYAIFLAYVTVIDILLILGNVFVTCVTYHWNQRILLNKEDYLSDPRPIVIPEQMSSLVSYFCDTGSVQFYFSASWCIRPEVNDLNITDEHPHTAIFIVTSHCRKP